MQYITIRQRENGKSHESSIFLDDDNRILINVDGHQVTLDDARCICLMQMLRQWAERKGIHVEQGGV